MLAVVQLAFFTCAWAIGEIVGAWAGAGDVKPWPIAQPSSPHNERTLTDDVVEVVLLNPHDRKGVRR
jgi:hypothetical protein